jgi:SsrA-binding protein
MSDEKKRNIKLIANNKKAYHDYFITETYQAGIELTGTEVKSLRQGKCNLKDSFVRVENGEAYIFNMHISPYEQGNIFNKDPMRNRRLLLHKYEINKLVGAVTREGLTIVPVKIYFYGSLVKVDIAIAKGKKLYDKRADIAEKTARREAEREFRVRNL